MTVICPSDPLFFRSLACINRLLPPLLLRLIHPSLSSAQGWPIAFISLKSPPVTKQLVLPGEPSKIGLERPSLLSSHLPSCVRLPHALSLFLLRCSSEREIDLFQVSFLALAPTHTHVHVFSTSLLTVVIDSTRRDPSITGTRAGHSEHCTPFLNSTPGASWGEGKNAGYLGKGFEIPRIRTA
ncbi:hypothetical protein E1301_Tti014224 [Triplophysa tibetana]|uniref:Uncharacterized protein n=1 Tax=Triplophysa tibetana TaxID=1572043 RepID=A0A5A9N343_9TELE|nr:hypothetical protein E1301_Tti014224 [Triplophysa tibetana]